MFAHRPVVGCRIGPCHRQAVRHVLGSTGTCIVETINRELVQRREAAVFVRCIYSTEYGTELQVLNGLQFGIHITRESHVLILVIAVGHHASVRVAICIIPIRVGRIVIR